MAVSLGVASTLASGAARACSPPLECEPNVALPGGSMPANAPGLWWTPLGSAVTSTASGGAVTVTDAMGQAVPGVTVEALAGYPTARFLRFASPLAPNAMYRVQGVVCSRGAAADLTFRTAANAPLPTTLGALAVGEPESQYLTVANPLGFSDCGSSFPAVTRTLSVQLSPEAMPWANAIAYEVTVDGQRWFWKTFRRDSTPVTTGLRPLFVRCGAADGGTFAGAPALAEGSHDVAVTAFIPGSDVRVTLRSSVALHCQGGGPSDAATSTDGPSGDVSAATDTSGDLGAPSQDASVANDLGLSVDAGAVTDTGAVTDASADAGAVTDAGAAADAGGAGGGGGCSVNEGAGPTRAGLGWLAVGLSLGWAGRRRKRAQERR